MPITINFTGKIFPLAIPAHSPIGQMPAITYQSVDTGATEVFTVSIVGSSVEVTVVLDNFTQDDVDRHRNTAFDLARTALDLWNFKMGWGLSLYLDRVFVPGAEPEIIVPADPSLSSIVRYDIAAIPTLYPFIVSDTRLHTALNDLIVAITWPRAAPINCARAVEGLRTLMSPGKRTAGWPVMREALNLDRAYLDAITKASEAPRHGDYIWAPAAETGELIYRSWTIMTRFLEWKRRGETQLPLAEFPTLT
jgi:hypothetical protein